MLDHEGMHTQLQALARSRKDLFASFVTNYRFLASNSTTQKAGWQTESPTSRTFLRLTLPDHRKAQEDDDNVFSCIGTPTVCACVRECTILILGRLHHPTFRTLKTCMCRPTIASSTAVTNSEPHAPRRRTSTQTATSGWISTYPSAGQATRLSRPTMARSRSCTSTTSTLRGPPKSSLK